MANNLSQLKAASQKEKKRSDLEMLDIGETVWFTGTPVSSERGTLSLRTANDGILVLREKDIINVIKKDDYFEVNVRTGTPVIIRTEHIIEAGSSECGCSEKENQDDVPDTMAMGAFCLTYTWRCWNVKVGGEIKRICIPVWKPGRCVVDWGPKPPINAGPQ